MMQQKIPNTFGIDVMAKNIITATSQEQLTTIWQQYHNDQPILILGQGSNTLFSCNFDGTIILNRIKGFEVTETETDWHIKLGAGEIWHEVVKKTIALNLPGLENLALIPGCVGSAPIQNIGAYGVEFQKVSEYVDLLDLTTGQVKRIFDGQYSYRNSIFKQKYAKDYAVVAVGIKLAKQWQPILSYGELKNFNSKTVTAQQIFNKVCEIRQTKLPDPKVLGNGGSFFKNPIIDKVLADQLLIDYPQMRVYPEKDGKIKVAAGWLIDQCQLKGYQIGGAAVHDKQALVLINKNKATAQDIIELAIHIRNTVFNKFHIELSPEIRFMAEAGEINADNYLTRTKIYNKN